MSIRFGTSGWRAIIAEEFTFANVRVVAQSLVDYLKKEGLHNKPVIIGYDTRFLSDEFAKTVAGVMAAQGLECRLCDRDTPTPVVAFEILRNHAAGGVIITASHNPSAYSGIKFNSTWGGPALPDITAQIENGCEPYLTGEESPKIPKEAVGLKKRLIVSYDPMPFYFKQLDRMVDLDLLKKSKLKVVTDALWGAGRGYLDEYLRKAGVEVTALHTERDVLYGGGGPSPDAECLKDLHKTLVKTKSALGLATDGDADRFGLMDPDGTLIYPNEFIPLAVDHLVRTRGWTGVVARSVMTSHFLDAVARRHGLSLEETPVGFKYIGEIMAREESVYPSQKGNFVLGGEESGGLSLRGHVPEKDGVLACLLAAEMVALRKKPLKKQVAELQAEVGTFCTRRINLYVTKDRMIQLKEKLNASPPTRFGGVTVKRIIDTDGHKFILSQGGWIGVRLSGTEPVIRLYLETDREEKIPALEKAARALVGLNDGKKS